MNKEHFAYSLSRDFYNFKHAFFLVAGGFLGLASVSFLSRIEGELDYDDISSIIRAVVTGIAGTVGCYLSAKGILNQIPFDYQIKEINERKEDYELEYAKRIIIEDRTGLEALLEKTSTGCKAQFGTLVRAYEDDGIAIVNEILNVDDAMSMGLSGAKKGNELLSEILEYLNAQGTSHYSYNGFVRYYPDFITSWYGARNFHVHPINRSMPPNWINFLTFNMPKGPEIIGFNKRYTYIPTDRSKNELACASNEDILSYLE